MEEEILTHGSKILVNRDGVRNALTCLLYTSERNRLNRELKNVERQQSEFGEGGLK